MNTTAIEFDYFYGMESQQFAFYRIPKMLVKDERFKKVSNDAKGNIHSIRLLKTKTY